MSRCPCGGEVYPLFDFWDSPVACASCGREFNLPPNLDDTSEGGEAEAS